MRPPLLDFVLYLPITAGTTTSVAKGATVLVSTDCTRHFAICVIINGAILQGCIAVHGAGGRAAIRARCAEGPSARTYEQTEDKGDSEPAGFLKHVVTSGGGL